MTIAGIDIASLFKTLATSILLIWGAAAGWEALQSEMRNKADAQEVQELRLQLQEISRDVKVIRLMLCDGKQTDSYCRTNP